MADTFELAGRTYTSRLIVGTGKYRDFEETRKAVELSGAEIVTVAVRRVNIVAFVFSIAFVAMEVSITFLTAQRFGYTARQNGLLLGFLATWTFETAGVSAEARALLTTGLCGGYTTFSTFSLETVALAEEGAELAAIPTAPGSLEEALDCLEKDHEFLLKGDVFTKDFLDMWISTKRKEHDAVRLRPHPYEFFLYYDV